MMRPIDADALKETIKGLEVESPDVKATRFISRTIQEIFPQVIDDEPTIEAEPDNGWISVDDRLPEPNTWVLVFARQGSYMNLKVDYITRDGIWFNSMRVTHWQPLPEPPKGE